MSLKKAPTGDKRAVIDPVASALLQFLAKRIRVGGAIEDLGQRELDELLARRDGARFINENTIEVTAPHPDGKRRATLAVRISVFGTLTSVGFEGIPS